MYCVICSKLSVMVGFEHSRFDGFCNRRLSTVVFDYIHVYYLLLTYTNTIYNIYKLFVLLIHSYS